VLLWDAQEPYRRCAGEYQGAGCGPPHRLTERTIPNNCAPTPLLLLGFDGHPVVAAPNDKVCTPLLIHDPSETFADRFECRSVVARVIKDPARQIGAISRNSVDFRRIQAV